MKKNLFFKTFWLLCLCALNGYAQRWTPSEPENGGSYYLYNVGKGGFLVKNGDKGMPALEPTDGAYVILEQDEATTTSEGKSFRIDTHLVYASTGTNQDRWLVENTSDRNAYINVAKSHEMHNPWRFVPVPGKENVYYIILASGADANRHLEFSSLDKGTAANPVTRSTGSSTNAGAPGFDEWMLVTPDDYNAAFANRMDFTSYVGTGSASWTGAGGTAGSVTTMTGATTPLAELYSSSSAGVKMRQTVIGLDNGYYEVRVFASSHNARGEDGASLNGITREHANVFATSGESNVTKQIVARGVNPGFEGDEQTYPYTMHDVIVKDGSITIGLNLANAGQTGWHTIQIYSLVKTADLPLTEKIEAYQAALATAQNTATDTELPAGFRNALQAVIYENNDADITSATSLDNATAALIEAVNEAEKSRAPFARYNLLKEMALATDDDTTAFTGNVTVDVTDADNEVNAATTVEGINNAILLLRTAVKNFINAVTVVNGKTLDITVLLVNFDLEEGIGGWTVEGDGTWRNMYSEDATIGYGAEFYHGTRNIYQTVDGLPMGSYEASVQATWRDAQTTGLYLTTSSTITSQIQYQYDNSGIPSTLTSMANNPEYARFSVMNSLTGNSLTVGLKEKGVGDGNCWTLFDNFRLYYNGLDYSEAEARLVAALENASTTAGMDIPQAAKDQLNTLSTTYTPEGIEATGTYAEVLQAFEDAIDDINAKIQNAENLVEPYAEFNFIKTSVQAVASVNDVTLSDDDALTTLLAVVDQQNTAANTTVEADITAATVALKSASLTYINKARPNNGAEFDLSYLIVNAGFDQSREVGWTSDVDISAFNRSFSCLEVIDKNGFDIHQTLTGMPKGTYRLTVQAFQRLEPGQVESRLYVNTTDALIKSLYDEMSDVALFTTGGWFSDVQRDGKWVPNGMEGTRIYFDTEYNGTGRNFYLNEVVAAVTDNQLTLGFHGIGAAWTLFDNFQLYYTGIDFSGYEAQLQVAIESAKAKATALNGQVPESIINGLNNIENTYDANAVADIEALDFDDAIAAFDAAVQNIENMMTEADTFVEPFARFLAIYNAENPIIAQTSVYTDDDDSQKNTLHTAIATVNSNANAATTIEALNTQTAALYDAYASFVKNTNIEGKYFDLSSLIYNPVFNLSGRTGWEKTGNATGLGRVTSERINGYEYYNGSFDFYQILPTLAEGLYKFNVNAFHRISDNQNDERNADRNNIPVLVYFDNAEEKMMSIQEGNATDVPSGLNAFAEGEYKNEVLWTLDEIKNDVKIGLRLDEQSANYSWTLFSNFKLFYTKAPATITLSENDTTEPEAYDVANVTLERKLKADVWNTLTVPFNMEIPEGWVVKTLESTENIDGHVRMNFVAVEKIEAGVPYMVQVGENEVTSIVKEGVAVVPTLSDTETADLVFKGNFAKIDALAEGSFFIQNNNFYEVGTINKPAMKGYRAYLQPVVTGSVKSIDFYSDGETTAIELIVDEVEPDSNGKIYDLSGRTVIKPERGLYIINGKKVWIK